MVAIISLEKEVGFRGTDENANSYSIAKCLCPFLKATLSGFVFHSAQKTVL